jgi:hypothetical protein
MNRGNGILEHIDEGLSEDEKAAENKKTAGAEKCELSIE